MDAEVFLPATARDSYRLTRTADGRYEAWIRLQGQAEWIRDPFPTKGLAPGDSLTINVVDDPTTASE